jgi:hypothetical protein
MGTAVLQAIGSFAAGAIAWVALEFFGRPLRKFYDLRGRNDISACQNSECAIQNICVERAISVRRGGGLQIIRD